MRILLTGAGGQLGHELSRGLAPLGSLVACTREGCDLERPEHLREVIRRQAPDVIVNAAAYTAVDRAESEHRLGEIGAVGADDPARPQDKVWHT